MTQDRTRLRALAEAAKSATSPYDTVLWNYSCVASPDTLLALLDERDAMERERDEAVLAARAARAVATVLEAERDVAQREAEACGRTNDGLRAERDALAVDARRYRFIRDADRSGHLDHELRLYAMETLDEYVDAALEDEAALDDAKGGAHEP
jgi:hypothetical protein